MRAIVRGSWALLVLLGCGPLRSAPSPPQGRGRGSSPIETTRGSENVAVVTVAPDSETASVVDAPDVPDAHGCERRRAWDGETCVWAVCSPRQQFRTGVGCVGADGMRCVLPGCGDDSLGLPPRTRPASASAGGTRFDAGRTRARLADVDLSRCAKEPGPRGTAELTVVLAPEGRVLEVVPVDALAGTEKAKCIAAYLLTSPVPPFAGPAHRLAMSLSVP